MVSTLEQVISLAKRREFVYPCGEIYGGTRAAWDYGLLGVELKENIKKAWWNYMVRPREDVVGLDSSVILPLKAWEASGYLRVSTDPLIECTSCHKRYREDDLQEKYAERHGIDNPDTVDMAAVACENCGMKGQWTELHVSSGLLETYLGLVDNESGLYLLRPETAQGIFISFANTMNSARMRSPFGIGQVGKSFHNEIIPGNFIFRTCKFEQTELESFMEPGMNEGWHQYWIDHRFAWYTDLGTSADNLWSYEHPKGKLSHYFERTVDIEYAFGFEGPKQEELEGIANRTDYDLSVHAEVSGQKFDYYDQAKDERWVPYVTEPSAGLVRFLVAFLIEAYTEDGVPNTKGGVDKRIVLRPDLCLASVKVAVFPLPKKETLPELVWGIATDLRKFRNVDYDDAGAVGRRYRCQDEIGTPYCITVGFDSVSDHAVTVRERDSMTQERIPMEGLVAYLCNKLPLCQGQQIAQQNPVLTGGQPQPVYNPQQQPAVIQPQNMSGNDQTDYLPPQINS